MSDSPSENPEQDESVDPKNDAEPTTGAEPTNDEAATKESVESGDEPFVDDSPTGEVDPAALRTSSIPPAVTEPNASSTRAYSGQSRPSTRQLPAEDGATSVQSSPGVPATSSPQVPVVEAPSGKRKWRTAGLIAAAVVLLMVIASVGSELYIRHRVTNCIQTSFSNLTGTPTEVSISRRPMLLAWFGSDVPWVQVDTVDGGQNNDTTLHARAEQVSSDGSTVESLQGRAFVSYDRVTQLASESPNANPRVESITGDAAAGTINIKSTFTLAILSVPAEVTVKPVLKDGHIEFDVQKASALVFGLPNDYVQTIVDQVSDGMLGPIFKQIDVDSLKVTNTGMDLSFQGHDVNLREGATVSGGGDVKC